MSTPFAGVATGVGSWPGADPRAAAAIIVGELPGLPHIVELPERGIGADLLGRTGALLVDLQFDTTTRGYRISPRPGAAAKRARSLLHEDLDALEEAWELAGLRGSGVIKLQAAGPWTLAAEVELVGGHRVLTDRGAVRDFAESLAEGLRLHRDEVARRLGATVVVQLDEPSLPAVLAGTLSGVTGMDIVGAVAAPEALALLDGVLATVGGPVALHCCAAGVPWELLRRSKFDAVMCDVSLTGTEDLDGIGELLEAGKDLVLGLVPTRAPALSQHGQVAAARLGKRPSANLPVGVVGQVGRRESGKSPSANLPLNLRDAAAPALRLIDRLGFPRSILARRIGVSPACGLAGASAAHARAALTQAGDLVKALAEDPDSL